ncbi:MAG: helix-turn-helix domain-containing protein [Chloroflexi bacterium]|nr:helix-turn-helix domain-containing protein [Chloroflexota bacterium]
MSDTSRASPNSPGKSKRPYDRPTTADQRKVLFRVYEQTDSPRKACAAAHVGMATFDYWRPRFLAGGYAALEEPLSHMPHTFANQLPARTLEAVVVAKREHPEWGKQRIADELAKAHGWQPLVSASEVRRILIEAGLGHQVARDPKE